MRRAPLLLLLCTLACAPGSSEPRHAQTPVPDGPAPEERWYFFFEELEIDRLLDRMSRQHRPRSIAFRNVDVLTMNADGLLSNQTVLVSDGKILTIGPAGSTKIPPGFEAIDGKGRFLTPGLTDTHAHTFMVNADKLLDLANGVTTIREMCGFPWMLHERERIRNNDLLAPNLFVAGHILNGAPMERFATVITTPEEARRVVREQKAAGYEFVKVYDQLTPEVYRAVLDEAARQGLPVIGHLPRAVTLAEAIDGGQRTIDHFKGFLPEPGRAMDENPLDAVRGRDVWICPTFYVLDRTGLEEPETRRLLTNEEMRYVSVRTRREWLEIVRKTEGSEAQMRRIQKRRFEQAQQVFRDLLPTGAKFIAGTDSGGGYQNLVPGFALHEELSRMESLGMPSIEVLRSATVNAAEALGPPGEFGTVAPGQRADLLLLDRDPRETVAHLRHPAGVMVRGIWLDRRALEGILEEIARIYEAGGADPSLDRPTDAQITALVAGMEELAGRGWIYKHHQLEELGDLLQTRGRTAEAERIRRLKRGAES